MDYSLSTAGCRIARCIHFCATSSGYTRSG